METFPIAPAATRAFWGVPVLMLLVLVPVVMAVGRSVLAARTATFDVTPEALQLRGDWYGRTIPAAAIRFDGIRRVNLATEPALKPKWRTLGTGLPGYAAGWFRLGNGEKALVYLTDRARAVYIPTTEGYSLLLSPSDPDRFISTLRSVAR